MIALEIYRETKEYFKELGFHEKLDLQAEYKAKAWGVIQFDINEGVIEPYDVHVNTYVTDELNKKFKKYKIFFDYDTNLHAYFNPKDDWIYVFITKKDKFIEIEAVIGHEIIHREQNKNSNNNYFKQSEKLVNEINVLIPEVKSGNEKAIKKQKELSDIFYQSSVYEQMAYAYQLVKTYKKT